MFGTGGLSRAGGLVQVWWTGPGLVDWSRAGGLVQGWWTGPGLVEPQGLVEPPQQTGMYLNDIYLLMSIS